jgi:two-component system, cell cycle sensor histidine kinase and response regulator CckA
MFIGGGYATPPPRPPLRAMSTIQNVGAFLTRTAPSGRLLADDVWRSRHRGLLTVLWLHAPALFVFAVARGYSVWHSILDVAIVAACATAATLLPRLGGGRRACSAAVALGLLTASALVVHLSGGAIEAHFHFFVVMALLLLYEDWLAFLLSISYVAVHHGVLGQLMPGAVYNHPDAVANPWKWALIHAAFVAAASVANITAWRLNEAVRLEARSARVRAEENERLLRDLKDTEASLVHAESRYRTLVEQLPLAVYVDNLDDQSSNVYTSPQIEEMLGYPPEQWMTDPEFFVKSLHPDDRDRVLAEVAASHDDGTAFASEYRLVARDGREVWVRDHAVVVHDEHTTSPFAQGYLLDITEEKAREAQARSSQKMEAVGQLAGGIAHDFNNLLTVIQGYCSLALERTAAGERIGDEIEQVRQAASSASALTAQLLAFSRKENFQTEKVTADDSIAATEALLRRVIGEHVQLETALGAPGATIEIDRGGLEQILVNLIVNARDAVGERGRITIATDAHELDELDAQRLAVERGSFLVVRVTDDGCGIDEATQRRIFEPFFTTKPVGEGTGLGLSTVYAIVQRSGGNVVVSSTPAAGTTVEVWLPCLAGAKVAAPSTAPSQPRPGSERILLVEDEEVVRNLVEEVLEHQGYTVIAAENATDAVARCERALEFDLLVTDVVMPDINGWQLAKAITAARPGLPVVYMSGYADDVLAADGLREGERFLQKPFELSVLTATVRDALDGAAERTQQAA